MCIFTTIFVNKPLEDKYTVIIMNAKVWLIYHEQHLNYNPRIIITMLFIAIRIRWIINYNLKILTYNAGYIDRLKRYIFGTY